MQFLLIAVWIGSIACWIITLVKLFKAGRTLEGVLGILCGIVAFVMGWVRARELDNGKVMAIWTGLIILGMVIGGITAANAPHGAYPAVGP